MDAEFSKLQGKTAIVTGASSGIGLATARLLAKNGVRVGLVSRSKVVLEELSGTLPGSRALPADMTKIPQVKKMVASAQKEFGRIEILVNNAGQGYDAPVEKTNISTFRYIYDLNVIGPLAAMQAVIPVMRALGGGSIVNISSGTALMHLPGMSPYSSSKRALAGISLAARAGAGSRPHRRIRCLPVYHPDQFREEYHPCSARAGRHPGTGREVSAGSRRIRGAKDRGRNRERRGRDLLPRLDERTKKWSLIKGVVLLYPPV